MTEKTTSLSIRRFGRVVRTHGRVILIILIAAYALNNVREHFFILESGSEIELKRTLIVKALQLRGTGTDICICNDNIQGINVTGYRFMSLREIKDSAESVGDLNYCCISELAYNGNDASVTVMNICKHMGYSSEMNGVTYHFRRYFLNLWDWNENILLIF